VKKHALLILASFGLSSSLNPLRNI